MDKEISSAFSKVLSFIVIIFILSCVSKNKPRQARLLLPDTLENGLRIVNTVDSPFNYKDQVQTMLLEDSCTIYYAEDDSVIYLYLKNRSGLHLLNKTSNYTSFWHLGTVAADFDNCFILWHDNGNGSPNTFELIDKKTAKNILPQEMTWIDGLDDDILFTNSFAPTEKDSLFLYNVPTKKREFFRFPKEAFADDTVINPIYIRIDTLTSKTLTINFSDFSKTYKR